jgi:hypothetical protein
MDNPVQPISRLMVSGHRSRDTAHGYAWGSGVFGKSPWGAHVRELNFYSIDILEAGALSRAGK